MNIIYCLFILLFSFTVLSTDSNHLFSNVWQEDANWASECNASDNSDNPEEQEQQVQEDDPIPYYQAEIFNAISAGNYDLVKNLIEQDPENLELKDEYSAETPLYFAVRESQYDIVKLLLQSNADGNALGYEFGSIAKYALNNNSNRALEIILEHSKEFYSTQDRFGNTLIFQVLYLQRINLLELVLKHSLVNGKTVIDVNHKNSAGETIIFAFVNNNMVSYLLVILNFFRNEISEESFVNNGQAWLKEIFSNIDGTFEHWCPTVAEITSLLEFYEGLGYYLNLQEVEIYLDLLQKKYTKLSISLDCDTGKVLGLIALMNTKLSEIKRFYYPRSGASNTYFLNDSGFQY